jgi:hypothetical protein
MKSIQSEEAGSTDEALLKLPYNLIISDIRLKKKWTASACWRQSYVCSSGSGYHDFRLWGRGDQRRKQGKRKWDSSINHSAYWVNFSALFKRWGRKPTNIFNFTVMVERGGQ